MRNKIKGYDHGWVDGSDAQNEVDQRLIIEPLRTEITKLERRLRAIKGY